MTGERPYVIYGLSSSADTDNIRYVGITYEIKQRLRGHICTSKKQRTKKANWIKKVLNGDSELIVTILDEAPNLEMANQKEKQYILLFKSFGADLVNGTEGGDGVKGTVISKEARMKMSLAKIGKPGPWLGRKRVPAPGFAEGRPVGLKHTDETKQKISEKHKGRKHTDAAKINMSEGQRGTVKQASRIPLTVTDITTGEKVVYLGYEELSTKMGVSRYSILNRFKRNSTKPYKGKFLIEKQ